MCVLFSFFFFKQKTAYEMRISDWSSDVCSSDLRDNGVLADRRAVVVIDNGELSDRGAVRAIGAAVLADRGAARARGQAYGTYRGTPTAGRARPLTQGGGLEGVCHARSEERRVGREWVSRSRCRRSPSHEKKKKEDKQEIVV